MASPPGMDRNIYTQMIGMADEGVLRRLDGIERVPNLFLPPISGNQCKDVERAYILFPR